jgi:uncharacterized protein YciI
MWYLIIRHDVTPRQTWAATLDDHLAWMREQHLAGKILFSGPTSDIRTGIYVVRAADGDAARAVASSDPFTRDGDCRFDMYEWDVRQALGSGPFSTAELDASAKRWREAWAAPAEGVPPP